MRLVVGSLRCNKVRRAGAGNQTDSIAQGAEGDRPDTEGRVGVKDVYHNDKEVVQITR